MAENFLDRWGNLVKKHPSVMPSPPVWLDLIPAKDTEIIYAFVLAGLEDNHCGRDNLSKEQ